MRTEAYRRFVESFFGQSPQAAQEGPDVAALLSLEGEERTHAEQMLLDRLGTSDSRPAIGLGALGTTRAAPRLRALVGASRPLAREIAGGFLVNVAAASWRIEKNPEAAAALLDVLSTSPLVTLRVAAANELAGIPTRESIEALSAALLHDSMMMRGAAAAALVKMHGLDKGLSGAHPAVVQVTRAKDPAVRREAAETLRALLQSARGA